MGPVELAKEANEARQRGELAQAQKLIAEAKAALPPVEGVERAEVVSYEATLHRDLMRHGRALQSLAIAERLFTLNRLPEKVAMVEVQRGIVYARMGDYGAAIEEYERAARRVSPAHHPLALMALVNIVLAMADSGRYGAARYYFDMLREDVVPLLDSGQQKRVRWIEARLLLAEGHDLEAYETLGELADHYAKGNPLDAALALLDLAEAASRIGRQGEVADISVALASIRACGIESEDLATSAAFRRLAQRGISEGVIGAVLAARRARGAS